MELIREMMSTRAPSEVSSFLVVALNARLQVDRVDAIIWLKSQLDDLLRNTYRCFHCKLIFTEEATAMEHFGDHIADIPKCIEYGRTGQGGGVHDPWIRILKSEVAKAEADMILVQKLIGGWRSTTSDAEWSMFDQEGIAGAGRVHNLLYECSR
jgi:hypothetical protein